MHCKNYRAYTMAEAMAAVKADLGPDAIVLHTRTLTQGGFLGIGRKTVIEVTAARGDATRGDQPTRNDRERDREREALRADGASAPTMGPTMGQAALQSTTQSGGRPDPRAAARAGAASRAYGAGRAATMQPEDQRTDERATEGESAAQATKLDRDRTRLLAQAMAVKLERERELAPRTSAVSAASANAAATSVAAVRDGGAARGDASPAAPAAPSTTTGVAQRFVLVPAASVQQRQASATTVAPQPERFAIAQRVAVPPVESVAAPRFAAAPARPASAPPATPPAPPAASPAEARITPAAAASLARAGVEPIDLVDMNRLVDEVLRRPQHATRLAKQPARPERLESLYANLVAQEIGDELADAIITDIHASLTAEELASDHAVRSAAMQRIAALLPAGGGLEPVPGAQGWRRDGRALCVAFVGPTGVGKTTTVAKIAASLKLRYGARVGLITCDTYRIAAVDQLRTYAEIIGLPLEVVLSPGQMRQARQRLNDLDVILIDTAGRSQNDADRIGELAAMVKAAEPHETHLVLASVASEKVLLREAQAFAAVGVQRVVLTKLDEAAGLGAVVRVLRQIGRGVSYVTTGQEVPQHLESARPSRLAELVLSGGGGSISA